MIIGVALVSGGTEALGGVFKAGDPLTSSALTTRFVALESPLVAGLRVGVGGADLVVNSAEWSVFQGAGFSAIRTL